MLNKVMNQYLSIYGVVFSFNIVEGIKERRYQSLNSSELHAIITVSLSPKEIQKPPDFSDLY